MTDSSHLQAQPELFTRLEDSTHEASSVFFWIHWEKLTTRLLPGQGGLTTSTCHPLLRPLDVWLKNGVQPRPLPLRTCRNGSRPPEAHTHFVTCDFCLRLSREAASAPPPTF